MDLGVLSFVILQCPGQYEKEANLLSVRFGHFKIGHMGVSK